MVQFGSSNWHPWIAEVWPTQGYPWIVARCHRLRSARPEDHFIHLKHLLFTYRMWERRVFCSIGLFPFSTQHCSVTITASINIRYHNTNSIIKICYGFCLCLVFSSFSILTARTQTRSRNTSSLYTIVIYLLILNFCQPVAEDAPSSTSTDDNEVILW